MQPAATRPDSESKGSSRIPKREFLGLALGAVILAVIHQVYVSVVHPAALYMDSLRLLSHLYEWDQGRMSLLDIWGYGSSSHRGLITQSFLWLNVKLFSLDVLLANRLTGVVILLVGLLVSATYLKQVLSETSASARGTRLAACYFALLFVAMGFSPAGFELFSLDLGLPLWFKNLCFIVYFIAHARLLARPDGARSVLLTVAAPVVVLIIGMGWSYAFVGSVLATHVLAAWMLGPQARSRASILPTLAVVLSGVAYVAGGGGAGDGVTPALLLQKFGSALWLTCHAIGATFIGVETAVKLGLPFWIPGVLGLVLIVAMLVLLGGQLWRRQWQGSLLPIYLIAYGGLVAVSVSYARGGNGVDAVMAPRYYMDVYLFTVGVLWMWSEQVLRRPVAWAVIALLAVQLALWGGQLATQRVEWKTAPYRRVALAAMNEATLNGVADEQEARLLQSPYPDARRGVAAMRKLGVGVFRDHQDSGTCNDESIRMVSGWYGVENGSIWMSRSAVISAGQCECTLASNLYLPPSFGERNVVVKQGDTEVVSITMKPGQSQAVQLPPSAAPTKYSVTASAVTVPKRDLGQPDTRELSVLWAMPSFQCASKPVTVSP